jgi:hypothetical protein
VTLEIETDCPVTNPCAVLVVTVTVSEFVPLVVRLMSLIETGNALDGEISYCPVAVTGGVTLTAGLSVKDVVVGAEAIV